MNTDLEPEGVTGASHQVPALSYPEDRLFQLAKEVRAAYHVDPIQTPTCALFLAVLVIAVIEERQIARDIVKIDEETFIVKDGWVEVVL